MLTIEKEPNHLLALPEIILMRFPFLHWSNDIILLGGGQENHHYCHKMNMPSDPVYVVMG